MHLFISNLLFSIYSIYLGVQAKKHLTVSGVCKLEQTGMHYLK